MKAVVKIIGPLYGQGRSSFSSSLFDVDWSGPMPQRRPYLYRNARRGRSLGLQARQVNGAKREDLKPEQPRRPINSPLESVVIMTSASEARTILGGEGDHRRLHEARIATAELCTSSRGRSMCVCFGTCQSVWKDRERKQQQQQGRTSDSCIEAERQVRSDRLLDERKPSGGDDSNSVVTQADRTLEFTRHERSSNTA